MSVAAAIGDVSRSDTAMTADSTPPSGGDPACAFAMIDARANEEAPYFTNRRRDSFWSATNGLPQDVSQYNAEVHFRTHPRRQVSANDIGYMVQARRITGLMFRTLSAKNSWREGPSFREISHRLAAAEVRSGYCKARPCRGPRDVLQVTSPSYTRQ